MVSGFRGFGFQGFGFHGFRVHLNGSFQCSLCNGVLWGLGFRRGCRVWRVDLWVWVFRVLGFKAKPGARKHWAFVNLGFSRTRRDTESGIVRSNHGQFSKPRSILNVRVPC